MALLAWGFGLYGQSIYLAELARIQGWSSGLISSANTLYYLIGAVAMTRVHTMVTRFGPRAVLIGGALLMAGGACAEAFVTRRWQLFACMAVMALGWAATSSVGIATTIALWFDQRRGMALSLAQNGASAAGFTVAPALVALTDIWGLHKAVPFVLACLLVLILPQLFFALRTPRHTSPTRVGLQLAALWERKFWTISAPFAPGLMAQVGFIVHQVPFLLPMLGTTATALTVTAATIAAMLGRLALGFVIDRLNQRKVAAATLASQAAAMVLMLLWPSPTNYVIGLLIFGFSVGNLITLPPLIVARSYPPESFGAIVGLNGAVVQVCFAFGPALLGLAYDFSGGYGAALVLCAVLQLAGAAIVLAPGSPGQVAGPRRGR